LEISDDNFLIESNLKTNDIKRINENKIDKRKNKTKEEIVEIKDERHMMEKEQRQIFNLFDENNDNYTGELYKIAQIVLINVRVPFFEVKKKKKY